MRNMSNNKVFMDDDIPAYELKDDGNSGNDSDVSSLGELSVGEAHFLKDQKEKMKMIGMRRVGSYNNISSGRKEVRVNSYVDLSQVKNVRPDERSSRMSLSSVVKNKLFSNNIPPNNIPPNNTPGDFGLDRAQGSVPDKRRNFDNTPSHSRQIHDRFRTKSNIERRNSMGMRNQPVKEQIPYQLHPAISCKQPQPMMHSDHHAQSRDNFHSQERSLQNDVHSMNSDAITDHVPVPFQPRPATNCNQRESMGILHHGKAQDNSMSMRPMRLTNQRQHTDRHPTGFSNLGRPLYPDSKVKKNGGLLKRMLKKKTKVKNTIPVSKVFEMKGLGLEKAQEGLWDQALPIFEQVLNYQKASPNSSDTEIANTLYHVGVARTKIGRLSDALVVLEEGVEVLFPKRFSESNDDLASLFFQIGIVYSEMGNLNDALHHIEMAKEQEVRIHGIPDESTRRKLLEIEMKITR